MNPTAVPPAQSGGVNICAYWIFCKSPEFQSLGGLVSWFFPKILLLSGVIFFILVIIAGLGVIRGAGGGDPHQTEQSKQFLTFAITGLIIIFSAYWILQIINFVTGGSIQGILG